MDKANNNLSNMSIPEMLRIMYSHKKKYLISCGAAFLLGIIIAFSIPKQYQSKVMLSPETNNGNQSLGSLGSLTSMLGSNINMMGEDAINPQYYPNVMQSTKFIVSLFDIQLESTDGSLKTTLYDYCKNHQKYPWWSSLNPLKLVQKDDEDEFDNVNKKKLLSGVYLTQKQSDIVDMIRDMLSCKCDPKDNFITITATTQDALISTELVDSASCRLQNFIIEYRTSKARHDLEYVQKLYTEASERYRRARIRYASFTDAYEKVVMQSYISQRDELENQMQLEYTIYSQLSQQLQAARGKVMEKTPVFAVIEPATVPLRKSSPKRILIILGWMIVAFIGTTGWVFFKK